jgi:hypothetical protein
MIGHNHPVIRYTCGAAAAAAAAAHQMHRGYQMMRYSTVPSIIGPPSFSLAETCNDTLVLSNENVRTASYTAHYGPTVY